MHQYWISYRPVLHQYLVPVKYRSLSLQHRNFQSTSVLFCYRSFSVPFVLGLYRTVARTAMFRSVPLHRTEIRIPPQLSLD